MFILGLKYGRDRGRRDATVRSRSPTNDPNLREQPDVQARGGVESTIYPAVAAAGKRSAKSISLVRPHSMTPR